MLITPWLLPLDIHISVVFAGYNYNYMHTPYILHTYPWVDSMEYCWGCTVSWTSPLKNRTAVNGQRQAPFIPIIPDSGILPSTTEEDD